MSRVSEGQFANRMVAITEMIAFTYPAVLALAVYGAYRLVKLALGGE